MYPVYRFKITVDLGYHKEYIQGNKMFRVIPTEEEETDFLQEAINNSVMGKEQWTIQISDDSKEDGYRYDHFEPEELVIHILDTKLEYIDEDEWCLTWFSHYTFDNGQTDEEVLDSFREFVRDFEDDTKRTFTTLMGAEERWRWCGHIYQNEGDWQPTRTDPPCRCQFCKEQGVIRINH